MDRKPEVIMERKEYFTFIVLHYNCFEETQACVDSILALEHSDCVKIVVMDNASANDSLARLQEMYQSNEQVYILHNEKNLGFSAGNNIAYDYAVKHWDSSFVVFANNDLLFRDREFIRKVRGEYEKSHFGILSPDVFHTTLKIHQSPIDENMVLPKNRVRRTILFNTLALWFYPLYYALLGKNSKDVALSVTDLSYRKNIAPMGACLIFSRELMDRKPVIFSPETYFYYEEYILSFWCRKNNVDIVFQPDIQVLHNHGKATKSLGDHRRVMKFRMKNILQAAKVYYRLLKEEDI